MGTSTKSLTQSRLQLLCASVLLGAFLSGCGSRGNPPGGKGNREGEGPSVGSNIQIACGSEFPIGAFAPDGNFSGGSVVTTSATIDTSGAVNPAPAAVYQNQRVGHATYTIPTLLPLPINFLARLHFAEINGSAPGQRQFNVAINGTPVLNNFDISGTTCGVHRATVQEFETFPDADGNIVIELSSGAADLPAISGIELLPGTGLTPAPSDLPSFCVTPSPSPSPSPTVTPTPSPSPSPTPTETPTPSPTPTPTPTETPTPSPTPTPTETPTPSPTPTPSVTPSPSPTPIPSPTPTPSSSLAQCLPSAAALGGFPGTSVSFNGNTTVLGDIYHFAGSSLTIKGNPAINGTIHKDLAASNIVITGSPLILGTVTEDLSGIASTLATLSTHYANLAPTQTLGAVAGGTITRTGNLNIVDIAGGIQLSGTSKLTIQGGASDVFVLNVSGGVSINGKSGIALAGGVLAKNVLINLPGAGTGLSVAGNGFASGTVLSPNRSANLGGNGKIEGAVFSMGMIFVVGNGLIVQAAPFCPNVQPSGN